MRLTQPIVLLSLLAILSTSASATVHVVTNASITWTPQDITIAEGDTVRWIWSSGTHTVTEGTDGTVDGNEAFHSSLTSAVPTYEVVFDSAFLTANPRPGNVYDYFCMPHFSLGMTGTVTVVSEPGTAYCFGNAASGNPCPCNNDNDGSDPSGAGCAHDDSAAGAHLGASGVASVTGDTLLFLGTRGPILNSTLFFQANNNLDGNGVFLGDGIRCAGGGLIRLKVKSTDATGFADSSPAVITSRSATFGHTIAAGETLYYQWWFRDAGGSPCGNESNTSNGYMVTWVP